MGIIEGAKSRVLQRNLGSPAHDGVGATTSVGLGARLGLGAKLDRNTIIAAYFGGVKEATAPTVAFSPSASDGNTVLLNSALNGSEILIDYYL